MIRNEDGCRFVVDSVTTMLNALEPVYCRSLPGRTVQTRLFGTVFYCNEHADMAEALELLSNLGGMGIKQVIALRSKGRTTGNP